MKKIQLTKGKVALVDDKDFDWLNQWKWHVNGEGYAVRVRYEDGKPIQIRMHKLIIGTPSGMDTDHKDQNRLNNQRDNLRICNQSQNQANRKKYRIGTSRFKGVAIATLHGKYKYYRSQIRVNGKSTNKQFPFTPEGEIAAASWYNTMAQRHFGEYACLNQLTN